MIKRRELLGTLAAFGAGSRLRAAPPQAPGPQAVKPQAPAASAARARPLVRVLPGVRREARLRPVTIAPERVIRTIVGLRPFRPSGFVVRADKADEKTIVHNYGHGGAGITLSWGTAHLAELEVRRAGQA